MKKKSCPLCKKPDSYHHGDLKHAIIHASLHILSQHGIHALSLRAAAKQAGVSPAAPYRHFPNKNALLSSLAAYGYDSIRATLELAVKKHPGNIREQILDSAVAFVHFSLDHPELHRLMDSLDPAEFPELQSAHLQTENTFIDLIRQAQIGKVLTAGDPTELAMVAFAFIHGLSSMLLASHCQAHGAPESSAQQDQWIIKMCRLVFNGLGYKPEVTASRRGK